MIMAYIVGTLAKGTPKLQEPLVRRLSKLLAP